MGRIDIISYGTKFGHPEYQQDKNTLVFNCKVLENPFNIPQLRAKTGKDIEVKNFIIKDERAVDLINQAVEWAKARSRQNDIHLYFFCYGGKHRSVAVSEIVALTLFKEGCKDIYIDHLNVERRESNNG